MPGNFQLYHPNTDRERQLGKTECKVEALGSCIQGNGVPQNQQAALIPAHDLLNVS